MHFTHVNYIQFLHVQEVLLIKYEILAVIYSWYLRIVYIDLIGI